MSRQIIGPFNRVEGDLEVQLEYEGNRVSEAWVVSPLYRGFEQILHGKAANDALIYTPRICGICSVAQSTAAALALAEAQGISAPPNGQLVSNLILANENIIDHLTHFYLFFMPDFAREVYATQPWFEATHKQFKSIEGSATQAFLPARAEFMHMMGMLAGKWPHSLSIQPGGVTRAVKADEKMRLSAMLHQFRHFLELTVYGDDLEQVLALTSQKELMHWQHSKVSSRSDFSRFLEISESLALDQLGRATDHFMSYGVYYTGDQPLLRQGCWNGHDGEWQPLDTTQIAEDSSHSWMSHQNSPKHPFEGVTLPDPNVEAGYTWCKAPRLDGKVVETGALARQLVNGNPLLLDLVGRTGGNVQNRVIARLIEVAQVVIAMENWVRAIRPHDTFCTHAPMPDEANASGLLEAARGSLGHWVRIKNGRILNYQIVAPTTWNFSPRDTHGAPGALEQALVGAIKQSGEADPVSVQHIVRSFDPCMVCTVH